MSATTRPPISFQLSRKVRSFPTSVELSDKSASEIFHDERQRKDVRFKLSAMQVDKAIQGVPTLQDQSAQTIWYLKKNKAIQSSPCVDIPEGTEEGLLNKIDFFKKSASKLSDAIQESDFTQTYYLRLLPKEIEDELLMSTQSELKNIDSISDLDVPGVVSHIERCGDTIMYTVIRNDDWNEYSKRCSIPTLSYILVWKLGEMNVSRILAALGDVEVFRVHPNKRNIIAGLSNGQVVVFDLENQKKSSWEKVTLPQQESKLDTGHTQPITDVALLECAVISDGTFIPLQKDEEQKFFVSCSNDGTIHFWNMDDLRRPVCSFMVWKPAPVIPSRKASPANLRQLVFTSTVHIEYKKGVPSMWVFGTDRGEVFKGKISRVEVRDTKEDRSLLPTPAQMSTLVINKSSSINCVSYGQENNDVMLVVTDMCASVLYKDTLLYRITPQQNYIRYTVGALLGGMVFMLCRIDGVVEVWNVLNSVSEPVFTQSVSVDSIVSLCVDKATNSVLFGGQGGQVFIKEMPMMKTENCVSFLDREIEGVNFINTEITKYKQTKEKELEEEEEEAVDIEAKQKRRHSVIAPELQELSESLDLSVDELTLFDVNEQEMLQKYALLEESILEKLNM
ncbi:hypothetical protein PCE1_000409 [Barthelona sp. PCE]